VAEACIYVLAGTNGAGKSSVGGAMIRASGADYFNPDEATARILGANPGLAPDEANSQAWQEGRRLLERAVNERLDFPFETTLGGNTIPRLLEKAASSGIAVRIWYVALRSPELHLQRIRARVAAGGHDIPDDRVRARYDKSRLNLIKLLPTLAELRVFDNSAEGDPKTGVRPRPLLILHAAQGSIVATCDLSQAPEWTHPILAAALKGRP